MLWIKIERIVTAKIVILVFLFLQDYTVFESITKIDDYMKWTVFLFSQKYCENKNEDPLGEGWKDALPQRAVCASSALPDQNRP